CGGRSCPRQFACRLLARSQRASSGTNGRGVHQNSSRERWARKRVIFRLGEFLIMKRAYLPSIFVLSVGASFAGFGCQDSFKSCENTRSCPVEGDGDGDTSTGGGGGDGDGDGDTGGTGTGG